MIGSILSFSLMAVAGRAVSDTLDTFEIMMYRSMVGLIIIVAVVATMGLRHQITTRDLHIHTFRNLAHFAGQNLWFFAITVIPLAQVFALEFTSPLWVLVLSPLILGEKLTQVRVLAAVLGFVGILIVARPSPDTINVGTISAAIAAIGFAFTIMLTKRLTRTETLTCILFWMTAMQCVFGLVFAGFDGDIAVPTAQVLPWVVVIGLGGLVAHFCLTAALSLAPATVVIPVDFIRLPVIAVVGLLFYSEPIDAFVILGAMLIFGGNYLNIWHETRAKSP
ncbi:MAG: DMT family transporter [Roseovarius sp.]